VTVARRLAPAALLLAGALSPAFSAPPSPPSPACCAAGACKATSPLVTRVYPVADLVVPASDSAAPECPAPCPAPACDAHCARVTKDGPAKTTEDKLIELLTRTVAPQVWAKAGGPCRIEYLPLTLSLVVSAAPDVQEQVAELLTAVRRLQDQQVAIELRFVSVADNFRSEHEEELGLGEAIQVAPKAPAKHRGPGSGTLECGPLKLSFLDDKQLTRLLEHAQGDTRSNIMQAPKMTLFNGQTSTLEVADFQQYVTGVSIRSEGNKLVYEPRVEAIPLGSRFQLQPTISADRRFVRLKVRGELTSLDSPVVPLFPVTAPVWPKDGGGKPVGKPVPFTQFIQVPDITSLLVDQTLVIAEGRTAVLSGWRRVTANHKECGPPVLSNIPYVNRLFKNVAYQCEPEQVLVLVTPRIIIQEEEEVRQAGAVAKAPAAAAHREPAKYEVVEEEEETGCCHEGSACCAAAQCPSGEVCKLVKAYHAACAAGRRDEATGLAVKALALDPTCFSKSCCTTGTAAHPATGR
jgi:hypothetical protein